MKLVRLWRQYDSIKAVVLLTVSALLLLGYCIRSAAEYAAFLRSPTEYICTYGEGMEKTLPVLSCTECVRAYSRQKTAYLSDGRQGVNITLLSPAYIAKCFDLPADAHTVYMDPSAYSVMFGDAQSPVSLRGTLDGETYSATVIRSDALPQDQPFAVMAVGAAELQSSDTLRICLTEQDAFSPESLGMTVVNREQRYIAHYEQELLLLRVRFAALAAFLALLGAAAFFRLYRVAVKA